MDLLSDMKLFRRIAALANMSAAGRELGLSPGAVSQRLKALETRLGTPLLLRSTRAIALTPEGRTFLESVERILTEVETLETAISKSKGPLKGPLRVSAPSDLGRQYIAPMLTSFAARHRDIQPELQLIDEISDMISGDIDIAFRYGKLEDSSLISRPLMTNDRIVVASPKYLAEYGVPEHPKDLAHHRCLALMRNKEKMPWSMIIDGRHVSLRLTPALSTNDGEMLRVWALNHQGLAYKSFLDVAEDIDAGRLIPVLKPYSATNVGLNLIFPAARSAVPRIRSFINFAVERFRDLSSSLQQR